MKLCRYCLSELKQKEGETDKNWEARVYCDRICSSKHREEKKRGK